VATIEMSCAEVWQEVSNYIDEAVEPGLRLRMEEHFKGCKHCVAVLDGTRNVVRLVGDGQVFDVPAGFGDRLKASLARKLGG
jgi:putative zinc finger protein